MDESDTYLQCRAKLILAEWWQASSNSISPKDARWLKYQRDRWWRFGQIARQLWREWWWERSKRPDRAGTVCTNPCRRSWIAATMCWKEERSSLIIIEIDGLDTIYIIIMVDSMNRPNAPYNMTLFTLPLERVERRNSNTIARTERGTDIPKNHEIEKVIWISWIWRMKI